MQQLRPRRGELWSAQMLHAYLESQDHRATWLDARKALVVEPNSNTVSIDWQTSKQKLEVEQTHCLDTDRTPSVRQG